MASALALGAALAIAPPAAPSSPAPQPTSFVWEAPDDCPSSEYVRAAVEAQLGGSLEELALESWSVQGRVEADPEGGFRLALTITTPDGTHERPLYDPTSCDVVSDSAALLIALALDPEAGMDDPPPTTTGSTAASDTVSTEPETEPAEETTKPDPPPPEPPRPPVDKPDPPELERDVPLVFAFGIGSGIDWGTLRGVSPIGRANFAWQLPKVRVGASVTSGAAPRFTLPPLSETITLWMWTVGVEAGPVFRVGPIELPIIGGLEVGQLVVWPRELLDPTRQQATWAAVLVTPGIAWVPKPWLALVARVGGTISLVRPSFAVEGVGTLHEPKPFGVRATLGLEFRLPLSVMGAANRATLEGS